MNLHFIQRATCECDNNKINNNFVCIHSPSSRTRHCGRESIVGIWLAAKWEKLYFLFLFIFMNRMGFRWRRTTNGTDNYVWCVTGFGSSESLIRISVEFTNTNRIELSRTISMIAPDFIRVRANSILRHTFDIWHTIECETEQRLPT